MDEATRLRYESGPANGDDLAALRADLAQLRNVVKGTTDLQNAIMMAGAQDLLTGHGYQRFASGKGRMDDTGVQMLAGLSTDGALVPSRSIVWVPPSPAGTSQGYKTQAQLFSTAVKTKLWGYMDVSGSGYNNAYFLQAQTVLTDNGGFVSVASNSAGATPTAQAELGAGDTVSGSTARLTLYNSATDGYLKLINVPLWLPNYTSDPGTLHDGEIWYRSDITKLRARINAVTQNIATEAFVTGNFATNAILLGSAAAAGAATTALRSNDTIAAFDLTVPVTQAFSDAAATGSVNFAARRDHRHGMPASSIAFSTNTILLGTAAAAGVSANPSRSDDTIAAFDASVPVTQAMGDAAATGSIAFAARRDHKHGMPSFATNAIVLGSAVAAGVATTPFRSDDTIKAFDTTAPVVQAMGDAAAVGTIAFAARRDHVHGMPAFATNAILLGSAAAAGAATTPHRSNDTIAAFDTTAVAAVTPDGTATVGTINFAARRDHQHGFATSSATPITVDATAAAAGTSAHSPSRDDHRHQLGAHGAASHTDITRSFWLKAADATLNGGTFATLGTGVDGLRVVALADAATQSCFWNFIVPNDWASGALTVTPYWVPGATDAVSHAVRWQYETKERTAGQDVTAAGTLTNQVGTSAARTVNLLAIDIATATITPSGTNNLVQFQAIRVGADGTDTYVGVVNLVGVLVTYTANQ